MLVTAFFRRAAFIALLSIVACTLNPGPSRPPKTLLKVSANRSPIDDGTLGLMPLPRIVRRAVGEIVLGSEVVIRTRGKSAADVGLMLATDLENLGISSTIDEKSDRPAVIELEENADANHGAEGYELVVDGAGVRILSATRAGLFYGVATFDQLVTADGRKPRAIPFVNIVDWPEFRWRGLHLDVSRHFFATDVVERYIDVAARFKLNVFHWHLTDDQGWRITIPKYPQLTKIGGCRTGTQTGGFGSTTTDDMPTCDWYSPADIREVVSYAKSRNVLVLPEVEGPGHSVEALASYGYLACEPGPYKTLELWGSTKYSVCPTEKVFAFYDDVFAEIGRSFPGSSIHIGGDEVPYYSWRRSEYVDSLMRREGLRTYREVQGYFTRRLESLAEKRGKRIVGWDEVYNAGTSTRAIVMAWTGSSVGFQAARRGNDVVMSPSPPLYFDAYQGPPAEEPSAIGGMTTLEAVYSYNPAAGATAEERKHILGAQGNLWSEYIGSPEHLWYMAYPRALALSELCWLPRQRMSWKGFKGRLGVALQRLEPLGVTFRIPEVKFLLESPHQHIESLGSNQYRVDLPAGVSAAKVMLVPPVPNATVYFTVDGSRPSARAGVRYRIPFDVPVRRDVVVRAIATLEKYHASSTSYLTISPQ
jgi:hexosaminidase